MSSLFDSSRRTGRLSRRRACRPQAEVLEARRLLAAVTITEFPIPTAGSGPVGIAAGYDGNLWFTDQGSTSGVHDRIGRITPSGAVTEYPLPTPISGLSGITAGPDGNLWFTEAYANKIGRITPNGVITEFNLPPHDPSAHPTGITAGADGNLWFTESGESSQNGEIGRIAPSGEITLFPLPTRSFPPARDLGTGITLGPNGNVWFTEHRFGSNNDLIGEITPEGVITEYDLPGPNSYPTGITAGPDGNLWFTENTFDVARIGRITPGGTVTEFPLPSLSGPFGIVTGPDGNLWFTEADGKIGQITPSGTISEFPLAGGGSAYGITAGPNHTLWFAERAYPSNLIGKITFQGLRSTTVTTVDDAVQGTGPNQFHYVGSWAHITNTSIPISYNDTVSITDIKNDYATINFIGSQILLYVAERNNRGIAAVSIDGGPETNVDEYALRDAGDVLVYTSPRLASGAHTLKVRNTGTKDASSSGARVDIDRVDILA